MSSIMIHPSELAYAFSFSRTEELVAWGTQPFAPADGDAAAWFSQGQSRLVETGRLVGDEETGFNFAEWMTGVLLALADPTIVMSAERKEGEGLRRMTVHVAGDDFVGLSLRTDGMLELTRFANLTAAAAACAAFIGAVIAPAGSDARIDTRLGFLSKLYEYANAGKVKASARALMSLGVPMHDAVSATKALAAPGSKGVLSVFYCAGNMVQEVEPFSVMTNQDNQTWVLFPPASIDAPMTLERSSTSSLAARISVGIVARLGVPA